MRPVCGLCWGGLILTIVASNLNAQSPQWPRPPLGIKEWSANGKYPDEFSIDIGVEGREVVFRTWRGHIAEFRALASANKGLCLTVWCRDQYPIESSLYRLADYQKFERLNQDDVIPLFGHLYSIEEGEGHVTIKRVTDRVPLEMRPAGKSRIISLACAWPRLFWEQDAQGNREYDIVRILEIAEGSGTAKIELDPMTLRNVGGAGIAERSNGRKPLAGEISKNDVLAVRGRAYRVLNVVSPQMVEDAGRLVGWIELSPEPVTPIEQDKIAALVELDQATWHPPDVGLPAADEPRQLSPDLSRISRNPGFLVVLFTLAIALLLVLYAIVRQWRKSRRESEAGDKAAI